jgi:DNA-binding NarL/FixJ family response regulator
LRVLIADHDGLARAMLRVALHQSERDVSLLAAGDHRQTLELVRYYQPAVVIIDTALPPHGALPTIARILEIAPATKVLTISVGDNQTAIAALRAGASGHVGKDIDPDELARLVARAADGEPVVPQQLLTPLLELVREVPDRGWRPLHSRLTTREWEIVDLLAQYASTQSMAERLVLSPATVYSHIKSLMRKLDVHSRPEVVAAAERLRREETLGRNPPMPVRASSPKELT